MDAELIVGYCAVDYGVLGSVCHVDRLSEAFDICILDCDVVDVLDADPCSVSQTSKCKCLRIDDCVASFDDYRVGNVVREVVRIPALQQWCCRRID